jgi:superfamily II DNA or RNA helicase
MKLTLGPAWSLLSGSLADLQKIHAEFHFRDKQIESDLKRFKKSCFFKERNGNTFPGYDVWKAAEETRLKSLLDVYATQWDNGDLIVPTGFANTLAARGVEIEDLRDFDQNRRHHRAADSDFVLRKPQVEALAAMRGSEFKNGLIRMATGCHAKGTTILMSDGAVKKVEDVLVGDMLMGPDSRPRVVLCLNRGRGKMYRVTPIKGEPFVVNGEHILSLEQTKRRLDDPSAGNIVNVPVTDYIKWGKAQKHIHKLYRRGIELPETPVKLDPYLLGTWLGDGSSDTTNINTMEPEVRGYWEKWAEKNNLVFKERENTKISKSRTYSIVGNGRRGAHSDNHFRYTLQAMGLMGNKHVPDEYLKNSSRIRLELLAGLMDTDGYLVEGHVYEFCNINKDIADGVVFLARSVGLLATMKSRIKRCQNGGSSFAHIVHISGDTEIIPCKVERRKAKPHCQIKNVLRTGFSLTELPEEDNYYGFTTDGDHLYLMGDFTVTHNCGKTAVVQEFVREIGKRSIFLVPSKPILDQTVRRFQDAFGKNQVGWYSGDGKKHSYITVATYQSVNLASPEEFDDYSVAMFDECHHVGAETFFHASMNQVRNATHKFGFSADEERSDGGTILVEAAVGPCIYDYPAWQAIDDGFLARPTFITYRVENTGGKFKHWKTTGKTRELVGEKDAEPYQGPDAGISYKNWILGNDQLATFVTGMAKSLAAAGSSSLILVDELEHGEKLCALLGEEFVDYGFCVGGGKNNETLLKAFNKRVLKILVATTTLSEGADTIPVDALFNLLGGMRPKQAAGRALRNETVDGVALKPTSLVIDFDCVNSPALTRHYEARADIYREYRCGEPTVAGSL